MMAVQTASRTAAARGRPIAKSAIRQLSCSRSTGSTTARASNALATSSGVSRLAPATAAAEAIPINKAAPSPCRIASLCALMSAPLNRICNGWPTSDFVKAIKMPNTMKAMANAPKSDAVVERATTMDSMVLLSADKA
jgi:hypothetical protein